MEHPRRRLFGWGADAVDPLPRSSVPFLPVAPAPPADERLRYDAACEKVRGHLMEMVDFLATAKVERPGEARQRIRDAILGILTTDGGIILTRAERDRLLVEMVAEMDGYGPLEPLLADDEISEIMVNSHRTVYIEKRGQTYETDIQFRDEEALLRVCRKMAEGVGRRVDSFTPTCDARLPDGSRINIVVPPIALDGTHLTIRKFRREKLRMPDLVALGSVTPEAAEVLRIIGKCPLNVLISGGTGSGKTTLLNCVTGSIDPRERIITCEDTAELQLQQRHVVRLETRPASAEGTAEITMRDILRNALRMKPNRIIVGEVRGAEALDLVQAMSTGHAGSMGTIHANNPRGALGRLETCIRENASQQATPSINIQKAIADSLDIIIQTQQLPSGRRVVTHISEVLGLDGGQTLLSDIFVYDFKDQKLKVNLATKPAFFAHAERIGEEARLVQALHPAGAP
ncbi:CpaF family protein [Aquabacter spiritensis]|uniref:Pilus assembly protein CpaF n=1 Tax=Aquabacter spiritensis TaxID=933073 RepID=A0A4R3M3B9_9HYPH|nr:CpaF family protein [Aquabacter spiritensis]TCT07512.1 pilus assembly protein CpaF [Aquabacter spiritensis]